MYPVHQMTLPMSPVSRVVGGSSVTGSSVGSGSTAPAAQPGFADSSRRARIRAANASAMSMFAVTLSSKRSS